MSQIIVKRELEALNGSVQYCVEESSTYVRVYRAQKSSDPWEQIMSLTRDEWELLTGIARPGTTS